MGREKVETERRLDRKHGSIGITAPLVMFRPWHELCHLTYCYNHGRVSFLPLVVLGICPTCSQAPSTLLSLTDQHRNTAFAHTGRMRHCRHPALTSAIALPVALFICFSLYVLKSANTNPSPPPFRFQLGTYHPSFTVHSSTAPKARQLSPAELMTRPLPTSRTHMPKLIHQSWSTASLPKKFEQWSLSCREMNPDFEWVLWTDKDNRRLVETYAPEFLAKYDGLKSEIYRADAVRNLYMFVFAG